MEAIYGSRAAVYGGSAILEAVRLFRSIMAMVVSDSMRHCPANASQLTSGTLLPPVASAAVYGGRDSADV
eukprot:616592-Rhodomonas_salina.1